MTVQELTEESQILELLAGEPEWTAYALCDLDEPYRQNARFLGWTEQGRTKSIVLLYSLPGVVALLPFGQTEGIVNILGEAQDFPHEAFIIVADQHLAAIRRRYLLQEPHRMLRMVLKVDHFRQAQRAAQICSLSEDDRDRVEALYDSLFKVEGLGKRPFFGAFHEGRLVSVAGTHAVSSRLAMGAVGGVFTNEDFRGQGLATAVTGATVEELRRIGAKLIVLNVRADNQPAIRAYSRLGFETYSEFWEGIGTLRS